MQRRFFPTVPIVVAGCLLTAACGLGGADRRAVRGDVQYGDPDSTSTTSEAAPAEPGAVGETAAPTTVRRPSSGQPPAPGGRPPTAPRPGPTSVPEDAEPPTTLIDRGDDGSRGPPGAFARTLLRPRPATVVSVERFHQRTAEPRTTSIARAASTLREVTGKDVDMRDSIPIDGPGDGPWTAEKIRAMSDKQGRVTQGGTYAVVRMFFLDGSFEGDRSVLGVAVRGDTLAVFTQAINSATTRLVGAAALEEAVLVHELGHLLGLVDLARDTGRDDPEHPGHSTNTESVMFWAVESSLVSQVFDGPPPREFDAADLADLQALREGA